MDLKVLKKLIDEEVNRTKQANLLKEQGGEIDPDKTATVKVPDLAPGDKTQSDRLSQLKAQQKTSAQQPATRDKILDPDTGEMLDFPSEPEDTGRRGQGLSAGFDTVFTDQVSVVRNLIGTPKFLEAFLHVASRDPKLMNAIKSYVDRQRSGEAVRANANKPRVAEGVRQEHKSERTDKQINIKELKKLVKDELRDLLNTKTLNESDWSSSGDLEPQPNTGTSKYSDAISVLKFFLEEKPEAGTPAAKLVSEVENMMNIGKQIEAADMQLDNQEQIIEFSKKIKDPHVHKMITDIMLKAGSSPETIASFIEHLKLTVSMPADTKQPEQQQQPSVTSQKPWPASAPALNQTVTGRSKQK